MLHTVTLGGEHIIKCVINNRTIFFGNGGRRRRLSCAQTVHLHFSAIYAMNLLLFGSRVDKHKHGHIATKAFERYG